MLIGSGLYGQTEWIKDESTWHYQFLSYWEGFGYTKMSHAGDTVINDKTCHILTTDVVYYNPLQQNLIYEVEPSRFVYQSGDTIWRYKSGEFIQLYNMSLSAGDTVHFMDFSLIENKNIVLSVDTVIYNNENLTRQVIGVYAGSKLFTKIVIIEKFGAISNPFFFFWDEYNLGISDQRDNRLRCYSDIDFDIVQLSNEPCDYINGQISSIDNENNLQIRCFPNPVSGLYLIESSENIQELIIWDLHENLIYRQAFNEKQIRLELGWLPAGTYILKALTQNKLRYINKFIKVGQE